MEIRSYRYSLSFYSLIVQLYKHIFYFPFWFENLTLIHVAALKIELLMILKLYSTNHAPIWSSNTIFRCESNDCFAIFKGHPDDLGKDMDNPALIQLVF